MAPDGLRRAPPRCAGAPDGTKIGEWNHLSGAAQTDHPVRLMIVCQPARAGASRASARRRVCRPLGLLQGTPMQPREPAMGANSSIPKFIRRFSDHVAIGAERRVERRGPRTEPEGHRCLTASASNTKLCCSFKICMPFCLPLKTFYRKQLHSLGRQERNLLHPRFSGGSRIGMSHSF
jgi:hypothetical protein